MTGTYPPGETINLSKALAGSDGHLKARSAGSTPMSVVAVIANLHS
jgi:hypothetical protein